MPWAGPSDGMNVLDKITHIWRSEAEPMGVITAEINTEHQANTRRKERDFQSRIEMLLPYRALASFHRCVIFLVTQRLQPPNCFLKIVWVPVGTQLYFHLNNLLPILYPLLYFFFLHWAQSNGYTITKQAVNVVPTKRRISSDLHGGEFISVHLITALYLLQYILYFILCTQKASITTDILHNTRHLTTVLL